MAEDIEGSEETGPPVLFAARCGTASVGLHRGSPRPGDERLAETEGFEPSIGLYNPITV